MRSHKQLFISCFVILILILSNLCYLYLRGSVAECQGTPGSDDFGMVALLAESMDSGTHRSIIVLGDGAYEVYSIDMQTDDIETLHTGTVSDWGQLERVARKWLRSEAVLYCGVGDKMQDDPVTWDSLYSHLRLFNTY